MGTLHFVNKKSKMRLVSGLLATAAHACLQPASTSSVPQENFVTSGNVEWELLMDSVMGGISEADVENMDDGNLKWSGQLSLENNGGFAQFYGYIGRKLTGFDGVRMSLRTTDPSRDFYATYARDMRNGLMFQHPMKLTGEFKSYEMEFNDYEFQFMGWTANWVPRPNGMNIRNVGMLIMDKNTDPFEVHIENIEGFNKDDSM